jgi:predicted nucleic acid-binding protein
MNELVFVDTNVFVHARDASQARKQRLAASWLRLLWESRSGRTSMQVLSEYYVTVTRKLDPGLSAKDAWQDVSALMLWRPRVVDRELMERGREVEARHGLSWWDSLIVAAAQLQDCPILLSEDLKDGGAYGAVTVRSPFTLSFEETAANYAATRPAHPSRGRPARRNLAAEA